MKALKKDGLVTLKTSLGAMLFQLYFSQAPIACDNFAMHCADGYYAGTSFHRVIPGFMAQGGDPTGTGRGGESAFAVICAIGFYYLIESGICHCRRMDR